MILWSDGTHHMYSTVQELKSKVFALEHQDIKSPIDMELFTL